MVKDMDENRIIDDVRALYDTEIQKLLFQSVTKYITHSSIKFPRNLKMEEIQLNSDDLGVISPNGETVNSALMGTMIDYLTRLVVCHDLQAFDFLVEIQGELLFTSKEIADLNKLIFRCKNQFKNISIESLTIKDVNLVEVICGYEQHFRGDMHQINAAYAPVDDITLEHIKALLTRAKSFFNQYGMPKANDYHCSIGGNPDVNFNFDYLNKKISDLKTWIFGDGDYLLRDALVDFKVYRDSKAQSNWKKQLFVYYLGLMNDELEINGVNKGDIRYLINFNPRYNKVYKIDISQIPLSQKRQFIVDIYNDIDRDTDKAQNFVNNYLDNLQVRGISTSEQARNFRDPFLKYKDGIHQISRDEYERFNQVMAGNFGVRCRYPGDLYLVKRNGFYAFFVASQSSLCILNGGSRKRVDHDLQYYYDHLSDYAQKMSLVFGQYQQALNEISDEIKQFGGEGKVHGSIVNIDYYNHVYLDPVTGEMKTYFAFSTVNRRIYSSVKALLSDKNIAKYNCLLPDHPSHSKMLLKYKENEKKHNFKLITSNDYTLSLPTNIDLFLPEKDEEIGYVQENFYDYNMYDKSRIMCKVHPLFDYHTVCFWRDSILNAKPQMKSYNMKKLADQRKERIRQEEIRREENIRQEKIRREKEAKQAEIDKRQKAISDARENVQVTRKTFDNPQYKRMFKGKHAKDVKIRHLEKHAKKLHVEKLDLYVFRKLIDMAMMADSAEINDDFWTKIVSENDLEIKLNYKKIQILNEMLDRVQKLIEKFGQVVATEIIVKDKQDLEVGFIDLQFEKAIINLDFINATGVQKKMYFNLKQSARQFADKQAAIYNVANDSLYFVGGMKGIIIRI